VGALATGDICLHTATSTTPADTCWPVWSITARMYIPAPVEVMILMKTVANSADITG
jgi:hypothetical protein